MLLGILKIENLNPRKTAIRIPRVSFFPFVGNSPREVPHSWVCETPWSSVKQIEVPHEITSLKLGVKVNFNSDEGAEDQH